MTNNAGPIERSEQGVLSQSFDKDFNQLATEGLGYDGINLQRKIADNLAVKITTSGSITYIGIASPGSSQSSAVWQAKKIDSTDPNNVLITWADSGKFSQTATDLTSLTYS